MLFFESVAFQSCSYFLFLWLTCAAGVTQAPTPLPSVTFRPTELPVSPAGPTAAPNSSDKESKNGGFSGTFFLVCIVVGVLFMSACFALAYKEESCVPSWLKCHLFGNERPTAEAERQAREAKRTKVVEHLVESLPAVPYRETAVFATAKRERAAAKKAKEGAAAAAAATAGGGARRASATKTETETDEQEAGSEPMWRVVIRKVSSVHLGRVGSFAGGSFESGTSPSGSLDEQGNKKAKRRRSSVVVADDKCSICLCDFEVTEESTELCKELRCKVHGMFCLWVGVSLFVPFCQVRFRLPTPFV